MTCHHTTSGPMLRTHLRDCEAADCGGCVRCSETHCTARTRCATHIGPTELTCPGCIGKTRDDLAMIVTLAALMLPEAVERGVNSEAAYLAGPSADPEAWSWRKVTAKQGVAWHVSLIEEDDERHPLAVTGVWEMMIRADYGPDTEARLTVTSAVGYLDRMLHRIANDPAQDFPLFATEIRRCRTHLEAVLHDSHAPETGAPCPACPAAQPLVKRYEDDDPTGASDRWTCRDCDSWWSEADYRLRVGAAYLEHAEALTASQIEAEYRVPPGTLRRWAAEDKVRRRGRDDSGRQLYDVSDVQSQRAEVLP